MQEKNNQNVAMGSFWILLAFITLLSGVHGWTYLASAPCIQGSFAVLSFFGFVILTTIPLAAIVSFCALRALHCFSIF